MEYEKQQVPQKLCRNEISIINVINAIVYLYFLNFDNSPKMVNVDQNIAKQ
jgi:hypothetical protein